MIALLQRVRRARVLVGEEVIAQCGKGLLAYIAIQKGDQEKHIVRIADKVINYRIFSSANDKMNLSVKDIGGSILVVPQFTLAANTDKGLRPSFSNAGTPQIAHKLFEQFVQQMREQYPQTVSGQFQTNMQVESINDGPATFILSSQKAKV